MTKKLQRRAMVLAGLLGLGLVSFLQGIFGMSDGTGEVSQSDIKGLLSVKEASADTPYGQSYYQGAYYGQGYYQGYYQSYYQGYYQGYYQSYYQGYYQDSYQSYYDMPSDNGGNGACPGPGGCK